MGLQINEVLTPTFATSAIIPSGSVISYSTTFYPVRLKNEDDTYSLQQQIHYNMTVYYSKSAYETGESSINTGVKEFKLSYEKNLTLEEYISLSGTNAFAIVEGWLVSYLENIIGTGKIVHIDFAI